MEINWIDWAGKKITVCLKSEEITKWITVPGVGSFSYNLHIKKLPWLKERPYFSEVSNSEKLNSVYQSGGGLSNLVQWFLQYLCSNFQVWTLYLRVSQFQEIRNPFKRAQGNFLAVKTGSIQELFSKLGWISWWLVTYLKKCTLITTWQHKCYKSIISDRIF